MNNFDQSPAQPRGTDPKGLQQDSDNQVVNQKSNIKTPAASKFNYHKDMKENLHSAPGNDHVLNSGTSF